MFKNIIMYCVFLILIVTTALSAENIAYESSGDNDVQGLTASWVEMWNSYDLAMVDKLFLQDPHVSYFSSEKEGLIQGIEAVRKHHVGFGFVDGGKSQENKLWIEDVQIQEFGTSAVIAGIWYFQRASDSEESVQKGPFTFVCIRQEEGWRLAHLNFSTYK